MQLGFGGLLTKRKEITTCGQQNDILLPHIKILTHNMLPVILDEYPHNYDVVVITGHFHPFISLLVCFVEPV